MLSCFATYSTVGAAAPVESAHAKWGPRTRAYARSQITQKCAVSLRKEATCIISKRAHSASSSSQANATLERVRSHALHWHIDTAWQSPDSTASGHVRSFYSEAGVHRGMQRCLPHDLATIEMCLHATPFCYKDAHARGIDGRQCCQCCMQHDPA